MAIAHKIRRDGMGGTRVVQLTQRKAILAFCHECMGFNFYEVEKCTDLLCPLFPFRNPTARKGTGSIREVSKKSLKALEIAVQKRQESL